MGVLRNNKYELGRVEVAFIVLVLLGISLVAFYAWRTGQNKESKINSFADCVAAGYPVMESYPEQCHANGQTWSNPDQSIQPDVQAGEVVSGQGRFTITFPSDWAGILKVKDSDWFLISGMEQPKGQPGNAITEVDSYGSDSPLVFSALIHDNFAEPEGEVEDFYIGKELRGKKYTKVYESDQLVGIGYQRFRGDRDYEYAFDLGDGNELRVFYSVYGSDPRNLSEDVDRLVEGIRLKED